METGLLHTHSFLRWVILALLLIALYRHFTAGARVFNATDKKIGLVLLICCDVMLLIGLYQYFTSKTWGWVSIKENGFGEVMKNAPQRFFAVEHIVLMLIAISLVHIGRGYAKKNIPDTLKHKRTSLFFGLALLIILISIPWPFREVGAGRGWF
jgi:hypothetical protein